MEAEETAEHRLSAFNTRVTTVTTDSVLSEIRVQAEETAEHRLTAH